MKEQAQNHLISRVPNLGRDRNYNNYYQFPRIL